MAKMLPEQERELLIQFLSPNHPGEIPLGEVERHKMIYRSNDTSYKIIRYSSPGGLGYAATDWRSVPS